MRHTDHAKNHREEDSPPPADPPLCQDRSKVNTLFDHVASRTTQVAGSPFAFLVALMAVIIWGIAGPFFDYSETWQLVINTATTIITFLMVFLIQQTQNKDSEAIHLKLNELLSANRHASNRLIGVERLEEQDLRAMADFYSKLAAKCALATEQLNSPENLQET